MNSRFSILLFWSRLAVLLIALCLCAVILADVVGSTIRGTTIAFIPQNPTDTIQGSSLLHLMDIRLGLIKVVSDAFACCLLWSPDGNRIAFNSYIGEPFVWNMNDGSTRSLAPPEFKAWVADWSLLSDAIVAWGSGDEKLDIDHDLYILRPDENTHTRLTFFRSASSYDSNWSIDGRYILFHMGDAAANSKYYRIEADGENMEALFPFPEEGFAAQFSPDGSQIVYLLENNEKRDLYIMNADGTGRRRLTWTGDHKMDAVWSPDGTQIIFQTYNDDYSVRKLELMNADGTERKTLATNVSLIDSISWSPDGRQILYTAQTTDKVGLYVINADGSNPRVLVQYQWVTFYSAWQPQP